MNNWLKLNGKLYSFTELKSSLPSLNLSPFAKATLAFCKAWFNGEKEFTLSTSGSTGVPKKITLRREQLITSAQLTQGALNLKQNETSLLCLDTNYIAGQMMLVRSFVLGMNIVCIEPCADPLETIVDEEPIHFAAIVPYQLQAILNSSSRTKLEKIKNVLVGGAVIDPEILERVKKINCNLFASYGMTETISHIALQKLNGPNASDFFQTLSQISIRTDERQCLIIKAPHVSNKEIITNDIVNLIGPNQFQWLGRWDNVINSGGVKIIPEKVEKELSVIFHSCKIENRFFVAGLPDEKLGQSLTLFIEGKVSELLLEKLRLRIKSDLNKFKQAREIRFYPKFIETKTGKMNRVETIQQS